MVYVFADCILDTRGYTLYQAGRRIRLRPKVYEVLTYLMAHRDRVVTKQELCEQVWTARVVSDAAIENCIKALRRATGDNGRTQRIIETQYGRGYRFVARVAHYPETASAPPGVTHVSLRNDLPQTQKLRNALAQTQAPAHWRETHRGPVPVFTLRHVLSSDTAYHPMFESPRKDHQHMAQMLTEQFPWAGGTGRTGAAHAD